MKVKQFDRITPSFDAAVRAAPRGVKPPRKRQSAGRPGIGPAMLGLICAIAVFGVLGLLYTIG